MTIVVDKKLCRSHIIYSARYKMFCCQQVYLKGGGHGKIIADFIGQIFSLSSVKTENIIFIIFGIH